MKHIKKENIDIAKKLRTLFLSKIESRLPEPDNNLKERINSTIPKNIFVSGNLHLVIAKAALSLGIILVVGYLFFTLIINPDELNKKQDFTPTKKVILEAGNFIPTKTVKITENDKVAN